ncbi:catalase [Pseudobacter ginsenosidimutans]|uniref:Catalase n=1 Tax=Pseudobacter ginsenosidimutans TaxID=661488 RepID=A0A4Q7MBU5_9BACT|nr:catalase [Pseudobacter ginsenosidimutans]QEC45229.1 catalase [Pseudobacter ginsenosidimutans]RZS65496.1 catalase [Pseudobacter ginsenosidimutans]
MAKKKVNPSSKENSNPKTVNLQPHTEDSTGQMMTTNQGVKINDDQNSLKAGDRGPTLMEDFIFREKMTHFDHERIPERIVHARGSGAHGIFELYESMRRYTKADFLQTTGQQTPVFVRFSTVAGSRGSTDLARDVRGFAVKFYTQQGNFDLVGNNMPVFFIQDAHKFPDVVHAVKPEPHNEMPQAASAHDTFWDFIALMPESTHMIMWLMSDRAIPRSYRMMEGFGVHTFRFVNDQNESHFVKFHWKPLLGVHSVAWDEAQKISGKDPDFHRRDLWESIEKGIYPEYELGVQIIPEKDEHNFDFDLLDPTKLIPEELVPVQRIGKLTLNRNPDNFFAETEQVAFHIGHVVPGIDFTNDPLLQGRLFSYTDTQLIRLGGPNFHEIPINRPIVPIHNNQRDGFMRQQINKGRVSYNPNSLGGGCPFQAKMTEGGFTSFSEKIDAHKVRQRSSSFFDHFSQAKLFYNSQSNPEKAHMIDAFSFELGKVETVAIRQRMLRILAKVDKGLAAKVAWNLGLHVPSDKDIAEPLNQSIPADGKPEDFQPVIKEPSLKASAALSMANTLKDSIKGRKIAILVADGVDNASVESMLSALSNEGAVGELIAPRFGLVESSGDAQLVADKSLLTTASVFYDAVFVPGGANSVAFLEADADAVHFLDEAYRHCKVIAADPDAMQVLRATRFGRKFPEVVTADTPVEAGIIVNSNRPQLEQEFITAVSQHRVWEREDERKVPA